MSEINYEEIAATFIDEGIHVFEKGTTGYNDSIRHLLQSSSQPAAFAVQPLNIDQLATTIKILGETRVPFGIKGGGSSRNPGASSTEGIQIYMTFFDKIVINEEEGYIDVGAGCLWNRVYAALRKTNQDVVGADNLDSSVAGFLLGGGYSLKSHKHGLGIDRILEIEVVLPDGKKTIVTANGEGSDLFQALKGGGNNFGIVTRFKLKTHEREASWSGTFIFESQCKQKVTAAIEEFVRKETRHKIALISAFHSFVDAGKQKDGISVTCQVYGASEPKLDQEPWTSFFRIGENVRAVQFSGIRENSGEPLAANTLPADVGALPFGTLPASQNSSTRGQICCIMVSEYTNQLIDTIASETKVPTQEMREYGGISVSFQVWPFTNSLGPDVSNTSSAWPPSRAHALGPLVAYFLWEGSEKNDKFWSDRMQKVLASIKNAADEARCTDADAPAVYPGLAIEIIDVKEVYRQKLEALIDTRIKYDRNGVMDQGGSKIPQVMATPILIKENCRQLLNMFDTVILVDDSPSMCTGKRWPWSIAKEVLGVIVDVAGQYDSDGIDLLFLNNAKRGKGLKSSEAATRVCRSVTPQGESRLAARLDGILQKYMNDVKCQANKGSRVDDIKGLNLIVITDGEIEARTKDGVDLESVISQTARNLVATGWDFNKIGINFVRVGDSEKAAKLFDRLDNNPVIVPGEDGEPDEECDLVDYTPYTSTRETLDDDLLNKMLLGGINKKFDGDKRVKV